MTTKKPSVFLSVTLSVLLSVTLSSAMTYQLAKQSLDRDKQFKVVDISQLTKVMMENLEESISQQDIQLSEEMIKVVAENEARKLYTTIANTGGQNDIIMPKSSVIYTPDRYEITEQIATKLGLKGVENTNLRKALNVQDN